VRPEFVQNDWSTLVASLERGDFDIILNGLEVTAARRERVRFTRPYYTFTETLVVRRDTTAVHALADLHGQRVGTLAGSFAFELLRAQADVEIVLYEGVQEPYVDLEQGRLAAVLLDNIIADRYGLPRRPCARPPRSHAARTLRRCGRPTGRCARRSTRRWRPLPPMANCGQFSNAGRCGTRTRRQWLPHATRPRRRLRLAACCGGMCRCFCVHRPSPLPSRRWPCAGGPRRAGAQPARRYGRPSVQAAAGTYVELFRGTPVLLQLYVLYYGLAPWLTLNAFTARCSVSG